MSKRYLEVQAANDDGTWETLYSRRVPYSEEIEARQIRIAKIVMKALRRCEPQRKFRLVERTIETLTDVLASAQ